MFAGLGVVFVFYPYPIQCVYLYHESGKKSALLFPGLNKKLFFFATKHPNPSQTERINEKRKKGNE